MLKPIVLRGAAMLLATQCGYVTSTSANEISYSNLAIGYELRDRDGPNVRGYAFDLQLAVSQDLYFTARVSDLDEDSADGSSEDEWKDLGLGIGFHLPLSEGSDFYGEFEYRERDRDVLGVSRDDDGFAVGVGLRNKLGDKFEYDTGATVLSLSESSTSEYHFGIRWFARPAISLGARFTSSNRETGVYNAELRFDF